MPKVGTYFRKLSERSNVLFKAKYLIFCVNSILSWSIVYADRAKFASYFFAIVINAIIRIVAFVTFQFGFCGWNRRHSCWIIRLVSFVRVCHISDRVLGCLFPVVGALCFLFRLCILSFLTFSRNFRFGTCKLAVKMPVKTYLICHKPKGRKSN